VAHGVERDLHCNPRTLAAIKSVDKKIEQTLFAVDNFYCAGRTRSSAYRTAHIIIVAVAALAVAAMRASEGRSDNAIKSGAHNMQLAYNFLTLHNEDYTK
jgi:metal-dependent HD superfamily phosphatase/phosphodiesterase